jgi:hypothetical protein
VREAKNVVTNDSVRWAILYPVGELDAWDEKNRVTCRASKRLIEHTDELA